MRSDRGARIRMVHYGFAVALKRTYQDYCERMVLPPDPCEFDRWVDAYLRGIEHAHASIMRAVARGANHA